MTSEIIANQPASATLGANVTTTPAAGTSETWALAAGSTLPAVGAGQQARAEIDGEIVLITSYAAGATSITVTRGAESTTPATHGSGAVLKARVTAGALGNMVQLSPAAAQTGNIDVSGTGTFGGNITAPNIMANPLATAGDVLVATTNGAPARLDGRLVADRYVGSGSDGTRVEAYPRDFLSLSTGQTGALTPGTLYLAYFTCPESVSISTATITCGGTAISGTPTHVYIGLYAAGADGSLTSLLASVDAVSAFAATWTDYVETLAAGGVSLTAYNRYALGVLVVGATGGPALVGMQRGNTGNKAWERQPVMAYAIQSLSALPSSQAAPTGFVSTSNRFWFGLS